MQIPLIGRLLGRRTKQQLDMLDALDQVKRQFIQVSIGWSMGNQLADETTKLISQEAYINLPTDKYVEVAPGVFDRAVLHANDIKYEWEESARNILKDIDFSKNIVVLCKSEASGFFDWHHHIEPERFDIIKGRVQFKISTDTMPGRIPQKYNTVDLKSGDSFYLPSRVRHTFDPQSTLFCIITLKIK